MYDQLLTKLSKTLSSPDYYSLLLDHSTSIINEVGKTSRAKVADDIAMSSPKFSNIYPLLLAYDERNHQDDA